MGDLTEVFTVLKNVLLEIGLFRPGTGITESDSKDCLFPSRQSAVKRMPWVALQSS